MKQTNKAINNFLPKSFRKNCYLAPNLGAQYLVFHSRRYVYVVYLTRIKEGKDKLWKIDGGRYVREWKSRSMTGIQAALNIARTTDPTVVSNLIV